MPIIVIEKITRGLALTSLPALSQTPLFSAGVAFLADKTLFSVLNMNEIKMDVTNKGISTTPSIRAINFPVRSLGIKKAVGQKAHLPRRVTAAGTINKPEINTTPIAIASMGPNDLNEPNDAKLSADIATIVVAADPAIEGPTFDIALRMAVHLSDSNINSSRYLETINNV